MLRQLRARLARDGYDFRVIPSEDPQLVDDEIAFEKYPAVHIQVSTSDRYANVVLEEQGGTFLFKPPRTGYRDVMLDLEQVISEL